VVPNFAFDKFRHGLEQSCCAMATKFFFEEKVQQHDEDAESTKTGCRSSSRAHGKTYEQVPALICDSYAHHILRAAAMCGGYFAHKEQNRPPNYLGNKSEIAHLNFINSPPPLHNFSLQQSVRNPPFQTHRFPMNMRIACS